MSVRYFSKIRDPEIESHTFSANAFTARGFGAALFVFAGIVIFMPNRCAADGQAPARGEPERYV